MFRQFLDKMIRVLIALILLAVTILLAARGLTALYARPRTVSLAEAPAMPVAIVFGAGLSRDGTPSPVLRDRVETAANLYFQGKVKKLLMSGDNRFIDYNEPGAMRQYALDLGVPSEDIVLDYAGRRTYDTCYRAKAIFGVTEAILVTQPFHLPRALYLCNQLGVKAIGVPADNRYYLRRSQLWWNLRETLATAVALWEVWVSHPVPVLGPYEPIFPED
ncbi:MULTISPECIES: vancomycin high temperature exclusion protein [Anaerolinea]|uniref:SanA/YdcF family protein n=1 Tax=Anaerolinea TaxID=233189 RepID=UPI00262A2748|nr:ElyC/SanA/YdcF family protein [Anaerolinea thermophila]